MTFSPKNRTFPPRNTSYLYKNRTAAIGDLLEGQTASSRSSRRLLECSHGHFVLRALGRPTRGEAWLDLLLSSAEEMMSERRSGWGSLAAVSTACGVGDPRDVGMARSGAGPELWDGEL